MSGSITSARLALSLIAAALALGGCMEVVPSENSKAEGLDWSTTFYLSADLRRSDIDRGMFIWEIRAIIEPGLEDGLLRQTGETLLADGRWLTAPARGMDGRRVWTTQIEVAPTQVSERTITIAPPSVGGLQRPEPIHFTGIGPASPDTISWVPGSDITIGLDPPATPPDTPDRWGWRLQLERGDSLRLTIDGSGAPPSEVLIPGDLIPDTTSLSARFSWYRAQYPAPSLPYRVVESIEGILDWAIEPVPTGGGATR